MRIATWNVNSLRARHGLVLDWLKREAPDVLCMQETKVPDPDFPIEPFQALGYSVAMAGQKTYNGVAILSRLPTSDVRIGLLGEQAADDKRAISLQVSGVRVYCVYVPNGKSVDSPSFVSKLGWLDRLRATLDAEASPDDPVVVCGDFNIAPEARDVHDPVALAGQIHFHPEEHRALERLKAFGLRDALRLHDELPQNYTWWDYRAGAYRRNKGLRIDYLLLSEPMALRCRAVTTHAEERAREQPSDHVPVVATFE